MTRNDKCRLLRHSLTAFILRASSQFLGMNDIERVEVVKGPQSAFFGRATFGGAVNYITKTPGNEWGGDVQMIVGDNGRADFWGSALKGPLSRTNWPSGRAAVSTPMTAPGKMAFPVRDNLGAQETSSASLTLYATPTDNVSIKFRYLYDEARDGHGTMWLIRDSF